MIFRIGALAVCLGVLVHRQDRTSIQGRVKAGGPAHEPAWGVRDWHWLFSEPNTCLRPGRALIDCGVTFERCARLEC